MAAKLSVTKSNTVKLWTNWAKGLGINTEDSEDEDEDDKAKGPKLSRLTKISSDGKDEDGKMDERKGCVMKIPREDMNLFGFCPYREKLHLVVCNICSKSQEKYVVKLEALKRHFEHRHKDELEKLQKNKHPPIPENNSKPPLPEFSSPQNLSTPRSSKNAATSKNNHNFTVDALLSRNCDSGGTKNNVLPVTINALRDYTTKVRNCQRTCVPVAHQNNCSDKLLVNEGSPSHLPEDHIPFSKFHNLLNSSAVTICNSDGISYATRSPNSFTSKVISEIVPHSPEPSSVKDCIEINTPNDCIKINSPKGCMENNSLYQNSIGIQPLTLFETIVDLPKKVAVTTTIQNLPYVAKRISCLSNETLITENKVNELSTINDSNVIEERDIVQSSPNTTKELFCDGENLFVITENEHTSSPLQCSAESSKDCELQNVIDNRIRSCSVTLTDCCKLLPKPIAKQEKESPTPSIVTKNKKITNILEELRAAACQVRAKVYSVSKSCVTTEQEIAQQNVPKQNQFIISPNFPTPPPTIRSNDVDIVKELSVLSDYNEKLDNNFANLPSPISSPEENLLNNHPCLNTCIENRMINKSQCHSKGQCDSLPHSSGISPVLENSSTFSFLDNKTCSYENSTLSCFLNISEIQNASSTGENLVYLDTDNLLSPQMNSIQNNFPKTNNKTILSPSNIHNLVPLSKIASSIPSPEIDSDSLSSTLTVEHDVISSDEETDDEEDIDDLSYTSRYPTPVTMRSHELRWFFGHRALEDIQRDYMQNENITLKNSWSYQQPTLPTARMPFSPLTNPKRWQAMIRRHNRVNSDNQSASVHPMPPTNNPCSSRIPVPNTLQGTSSESDVYSRLSFKSKVMSNSSKINLNSSSVKRKFTSSSMLHRGTNFSPTLQLPNVSNSSSYALPFAFANNQSLLLRHTIKQNDSEIPEEMTPDPLIVNISPRLRRRILTDTTLMSQVRNFNERNTVKNQSPSASMSSEERTSERTNFIGACSEFKQKLPLKKINSIHNAMLETKETNSVAYSPSRKRLKSQEYKNPFPRTINHISSCDTNNLTQFPLQRKLLGSLNLNSVSCRPLLTKGCSNPTVPAVSPFHGGSNFASPQSMLFSTNDSQNSSSGSSMAIAQQEAVQPVIQPVCSVPPNNQYNLPPEFSGLNNVKKNCG